MAIDSGSARKIMLPARGPVVDVPEPDAAVVELLRMLRRTMGMDVAWLSQIQGDMQIMRVLDGDYASFGITPGSTIRAEGGYFARILAGELPSVIVDSRRDVGAGYSGLAQLIELRPDVIKVDRRLTHGIDTDPARRAVAAGLVRVTEEIGGVVLAEGIETAAERRTVAATHIDHGQGDGLAPPAPLAHLPYAGRLARAGPRQE